MIQFTLSSLRFIFIPTTLLIAYLAAAEESPFYAPIGSYKIGKISEEFPTSVGETATEPLVEATPEPILPLIVESDEPLNNVEASKEISINFNNISMIEFVRFVSRNSGKNFLFNEPDLQFNVTIISEEPTSIENVIASLIQELKIRGLSILEQGNNIIIHKNNNIRAPGAIVVDDQSSSEHTEIVTRVFRLNTLDPGKVALIIKPILSDGAIIEVLANSNTLIITDLALTVDKIAQLVKNLDSPAGGITLGQYAARNTYIDTLLILAEKILMPVAQGNPFVLVPHPASNSVFVVSNPYIVEKAIAILQQLDANEGVTKIYTLDSLKISSPKPGAPRGEATIEPISPLIPGHEVNPLFPNIPITPGSITSAAKWSQELPAGHIERTLFYIHKLKYRAGQEIQVALRKIADSLQAAPNSNLDLVAGIYSTQWIESSNSLVFTGTAAVLEKVKEFIDEIDVPLKQVFIEMLILDTTVADSLEFGVDFGSRFGGGNTAGAQNFVSTRNSRFDLALNGASNALPSTAGAPIPNPVGITNLSDVFQWGIIGRHLIFGSLKFDTVGALVTAIHNDARANILLNPKIITEDSHTAEIFVGETDQYKTQSIANDQGNVITNNYEFIDIGTRVRVTPLIGSDGIITLDIIQETTDAPGIVQQPNPNDVYLIPLFTKNSTATRVHVPDGYFVVLSGQIRDRKLLTNQRIPCLGGMPLIGSLCKQKGKTDGKRNLMLFIRPQIITTHEEFDRLTRRQQNIFRQQGQFPRSWNYEVNESLDFLNLKATDPNEFPCMVQ